MPHFKRPLCLRAVFKHLNQNIYTTSIVFSKPQRLIWYPSSTKTHSSNSNEYYHLMFTVLNEGIYFCVALYISLKNIPGVLLWLASSSYKLTIQTTNPVVVNGSMEEHCYDEVLKPECQREQELLKVTEAQFQGVNLQSQNSFKSCHAAFLHQLKVYVQWNVPEKIYNTAPLRDKCLFQGLAPGCISVGVFCLLNVFSISRRSGFILLPIKVRYLFHPFCPPTCGELCKTFSNLSNVEFNFWRGFYC